MNKQKPNRTKYLIKYAVTYVLLLLTFITSLTLVYSLPNKNIRNNIFASAHPMREEWARHKIFGYEQSTLDNYTDQLIAEMQFIADPSHPFQAAMVNYKEGEPYDFWDDLTGQHPVRYTDFFDIIKRTTIGYKVTDNYARYWHGYSLWVRPLLMFFTYSQIRVIMNIAFYTLLLAVFALLYKRTKAWWSPIPLALALLSASPFAIPMCWQYFTIFALTFSVCIYILAKFKDARFIESLPHTMFITGALTCFFDFLTTPLISCAFPIILAFLVIWRNKYMGSGKRLIGFISKMILTWSAGYVILWVSKWIVADLFFNLGTISYGLEKINLLTYGQPQFEPENWWKMPYDIFVYMFNPHSLIIFILLLMSTFFVGWRAFKHKEYTPLIVLIISVLMPTAWYMVVYVHSAAHSFFTFRTMSIVVLGISCALTCTLAQQFKPMKPKEKK